MTQTHHISYDPEVTIDILKDLHEKYHNHGTGKSQGASVKPKDGKYVICAFKLPIRLYNLYKEFYLRLTYGNLSEMFRDFIREGFRQQAPEIYEKFLKNAENAEIEKE